jgi:hypothetical protein
MRLGNRIRLDGRTENLMGSIDEVMNIQMSRRRCVVIAIVLELRIHEGRENPDILTRGPENLLKDCHDGSIVLAAPARMKTELGGRTKTVWLFPSSKFLPSWIQEQSCCRKRRTSMISWSPPRKVKQVMGFDRAARTTTL